jgi:hypothetical protein
VVGEKGEEMREEGELGVEEAEVGSQGIKTVM